MSTYHSFHNYRYPNFYCVPNAQLHTQRNRTHLGAFLENNFIFGIFPEMSAFMVEETEYILNSECCCMFAFYTSSSLLVRCWSFKTWLQAVWFRDCIFVSLFKLEVR
ncbi:hypothetical protein CEXT_570131 [Caerostris extrusa]|uniref:Uncharacterized protein n=1 Tax=Caerostris extrusa TaxID=172846 RepID=A0AAV4RRM8_CAEEX|nr:hypothetical protein CEXT_570131 [Caerostris extrusa]